MIKYSKWLRRKIAVTSLKLDTENARLPESESGKDLTQPQIINYLVENEKVFELAKAIATQGYFLNEEPIVCKEDGKFVVLEGNRRVAACKILLNPNLLTSSTRRKNITELLKKFDINDIKKIEIRIAPNRTATDVIILNRHVDPPILKWDKTKQDRFFYNRITSGESFEELGSKFNLSKSELRQKLIRFKIYEELTKLDVESNIRTIIHDESKFAMTNVERFYSSKEGREFLGIEYDSSGNISHHLPKAEYSRRLKRIAIDVAENKLTSRTYGDEAQKKKYIDILEQSKDFDFSIKPNKKFQSEYSKYIGATVDTIDENNSSKNKVKVVRQAAPSKLIPSDIKWVTGNERIDRIFVEMKTINIESHFNCAAILFRSYLDMMVYQYLLKNDSIKDIIINEQQKLDSEVATSVARLRLFLTTINVDETTISDTEIQKALNLRRKASADWVPSLRHMLMHLANSEVLLPDKKLRQALSGYLKGNIGFLDHNDFNLLVHNEYYTRDGAALKRTWEQMRPLLEFIFKKISN
jgi:hypothetical protein